MISLEYVGTSYSAKPCTLDGQVWVGSNTHFNDLISNGFAFTIAVQPKNQVSRFFGQLLQILYQRIHIITWSFDDAYISRENFLGVVISP